MWKAIGITCTVILYIFIFLCVIGLSVKVTDMEKRIEAIEKYQLKSTEYFEEQDRLFFRVSSNALDRIVVIEKKLHIKSH